MGCVIDVGLLLVEVVYLGLLQGYRTELVYFSWKVWKVVQKNWKLQRECGKLGKYGNCGNRGNNDFLVAMLNFMWQP